MRTFRIYDLFREKLVFKGDSYTKLDFIEMSRDIVRDYDKELNSYWQYILQEFNVNIWVSVDLAKI